MPSISTDLSAATHAVPRTPRSNAVTTRISHSTSRVLPTALPQAKKNMQPAKLSARCSTPHSSENDPKFRQAVQDKYKKRLNSYNGRTIIDLVKQGTSKSISLERSRDCGLRQGIHYQLKTRKLSNLAISLLFGYDKNGKIVDAKIPDDQLVSNLLSKTDNSARGATAVAPAGIPLAPTDSAHPAAGITEELEIDSPPRNNASSSVTKEYSAKRAAAPSIALEAELTSVSLSVTDAGRLTPPVVIAHAALARRGEMSPPPDSSSATEAILSARNLTREIKLTPPVAPEASAASDEMPSFPAPTRPSAPTEMATNFINHTASLQQWKTAVESHVNEINQKIDMKIPADLADAKTDAVLLDIVLASENNRKALKLKNAIKHDASGDSLSSDAAILKQMIDKSSLNLIRCSHASEMAKCLRLIHSVLPSRKPNYQHHVTRVVLHISDNITSHFIALEMLSVVIGGEAKTIALGIDSWNTALQFAARQIKKAIDREGIDFSGLLIGANTQVSQTDCSIFATFNALKLGNPKTPKMVNTYMTLLEGQCPPGASPVVLVDKTQTYNNSDRGAKIFVNADDNAPDSQILPAEILKETQKRKVLDEVIRSRQWETKKANKHDTLAQRYEQYRGAIKWPVSASTFYKRRKYFMRSLDFINDIKEQHKSSEDADKMLNAKLAEVRVPSKFRIHITNNEVPSILRLPSGEFYVASVS